MQPVQEDFTFTLTIDARCQICIMPRLLTRDLRAWDHLQDNGDIAEAIAQHVERRCSGCIEDCWVEEENGHFQIFVTTKDRSEAPLSFRPFDQRPRK